MRRGVLGEQDRRDHLGADDPLQGIQLEVTQQLVRAPDIGGRADHVVDAAARREEATHFVFPRDVRGVDRGLAGCLKLLAGSGKLLLRPADDGDLALHREQLLGQGQPHARAATDDENSLTFQQVAHSSP